MRRGPGRMLMLLLVLLALPFGGMALAQQRMDEVVQASLVDAGPRGDARLVGIVVRLADGWKTYWRVPGEGGLPPRFDFSGSDNVAEARVLWPAPKRFSDPLTGETIGYKHLVVFPVLVRPKEAGRPITLKLKMDYGVCGKMCVPVHAEPELTIAPDAAPDADARALVLEWLAKTPQSEQPGSGLQVKGVRLAPGKDGKTPSLDVTLAGAAAGQVADILVEGVELAVFGQARRQKEARDGRIVFSIPVRGLAEVKDFAGKTLRLTIVLNGERAIERTARLP